MLINSNNITRNISAKISNTEINLAKAYIQGAVHSHCNNNPEKNISVRILFGGNNNDWTHTPLQCIYNYYKNIKMVADPVGEAAKDVGWLFKEILQSDERTFELVGKDTGSIYKIILK